MRNTPKTKRKRKNKITKRAMLQIENRKERSKIQINDIFDGKDKTNRAESTTHDLIKEHFLKQKTCRSKGVNEY